MLFRSSMTIPTTKSSRYSTTYDNAAEGRLESYTYLYNLQTQVTVFNDVRNHPWGALEDFSGESHVLFLDLDAGYMPEFIV